MVRENIFKTSKLSKNYINVAFSIAMGLLVFMSIVVCVFACGLCSSSAKQVVADDGSQNISEPLYSINNLVKLRKNGDNVYLIDSASNSLVFGTSDEVRAGTAKVITSRQEIENGNSATKIVPYEALKDVTILQNGEIFLIDGEAGGIHEYSKTGEFAVEHSNFESGVYINYLISIASDYNDNVFALQKENGYNILKKGINDRYFSKVFSLNLSQVSELGITFDENAKIICTFENETIYIVCGGKLLKVALEDTIPNAQIYATYEGTCVDVGMDYLGYPYLVLDGEKIVRYADTIVSLSLSTTSCAFDCESGVITYLKDAENFAYFTSEFVNNLKRFEHEINYSKVENLTVGVEVCKVNAGTGAYLYKYPFKIVRLGQLNYDTRIIKLKEIENYSGYTYVLACVDGKMVSGYIDTNKLTACVDSDVNVGEFYTFTANTKLFKYPTADIINEESAIVLKRVPNGTELYVQSGVYGYTDAQDREFYQVLYQDKIYYVMRALVTDDKTVTTSGLQLKSNNAHLKGDTPAQIFSGIDGANVVGEVAVGGKFYTDADKFDSTSDYTYIEYLDEDNNFICGFIPTKIVSLDIVSPLLILAVFLIAIVVILVLILVLYAINHVRKSKRQGDVSEN